MKQEARDMVMRSVRAGRSAGLCVLIAAGVLAPGGGFSQSFQVDTPGGPFTIELSHAGPGGSLVDPASPEPTAFRPPSIFSAPLPSGSGARALGLAGAFTAVADDATAASWNPAGLVQLERPEFSAVYRAGRDRTTPVSDDPSFSADAREVDTDNLNYASMVYPLFVEKMDRNVVLSLNYQEAYDFAGAFRARGRQGESRRAKGSDSATFSETQVEKVKDGIVDMTVTSYKTTMVESSFDQLLRSDLLSSVDFEQEGVIAATTPSLALEITPKLSAGVSFNIYREDPFSNRGIRSVSRATYEGTTRSTASIFSTRTTSGSYEYQGTATFPPGGGIPVPVEVPFSGSGTFEPFSNEDSSSRNEQVRVRGTLEEINEFKDLEGENFTLGLLYTVNRYLTLGAAVDLGWTADTVQRQTTRNHLQVMDDSGTRVLEETESVDSTSRNVEIEFPLFWSAGALVRWTQQFYTSLDVAQTLWSDYSYRAEGDIRINPLDGSPHASNPLDDTWSVRFGAEYLLLFSTTEIPLRAGFGWEERPAPGKPDDYYSISFGTGFSIGKDPGKTIIDLAYVYTWADDTTSLVPEQVGLTADAEEHQVFLSVIRHL